MRIHMPEYNKNQKKMKTVNPNPFHGVLRDVEKIRDDLWQVKISTELTNLSNMYLGLSDSEMEMFIREWKKNESAESKETKQ